MKILLNKKIILLAILIACILSVLPVSAANDTADDITGADNADEINNVYGDFASADDLENDNNQDILKNSDSQSLISADDDEYFDFEENAEDEYDYFYEKGILKPAKLTTTYSSGKTFNVKVVSVHDQYYNLDGVKIKISVYTKNSHKDFYAFTDSNGIAKFKVSKLSLGTHKVKIYSADYYTNAKSVTSKIVINKVKTKVYAPAVKTYYKKSKTFKIKITDKATKKAVKKVKISVKVGNKYYTLKTNNKGIASLRTAYFKAGTYNVLIKSKSSLYNIFAKSKIIVKKAPVKKATSSSSAGGSYVGNANTGKFHYSYCSAVSRMSASNKVYLTYQQAINGGYDSCKICNP